MGIPPNWPTSFIDLSANPGLSRSQGKGGAWDHRRGVEPVFSHLCQPHSGHSIVLKTFKAAVAASTGYLGHSFPSATPLPMPLGPQRSVFKTFKTAVCQASKLPKNAKNAPHASRQRLLEPHFPTCYAFANATRATALCL